MADLPLAVGPAMIVIGEGMQAVITLIADSRKLTLSESLIADIKALLGLRNIKVGNHHWRKEEIACELKASGNLEAISDALHESLRAHAIDFIVQPDPKPQYKLLITDMDSTMITVECIDELADFAGKKKEVAEITHRAMNGELVFEDTLRARVALLAGLPESVLQQCYYERVKLMPGAKELVAHMRKNGAHTVLVSGGFTFFTSRVRQALNMHEDFSNTLEIKDGVLTGKVIPPILGKEDKLATLKKKCSELNIHASEVLAIGDGANDLPMLLAAGLGVAYHAKPVVRAQARAQISYCDLSALTYL